MDRKIFNLINNDEYSAYKKCRSIIFKYYKFTIFISIIMLIVLVLEYIFVVGDNRSLIISITIFVDLITIMMIYAQSTVTFNFSDEQNFVNNVKIYKMLKKCKNINIGAVDFDNVYKKITKKNNKLWKIKTYKKQGNNLLLKHFYKKRLYPTKNYNFQYIHQLFYYTEEVNLHLLTKIRNSTAELTDIYKMGVMYLEIIISERFDQDSVDSILFDVEYEDGMDIGIELSTGNVYYAYNPFLHFFHENRRLNKDIKRVLKRLKN